MVRVCFFVAVVICPSVAFSEATNAKLNCTVVGVDFVHSKIIVSEPYQSPRTFDVNSKTKIAINGRPGKLSDIAPRSSCVIRYDYTSQLATQIFIP